MKRIFLTAIAVTFLINVKSFAQIIPNSGFENWTVVTSYSEPDGWMSGNQGSTGLGLGAGVNESSDSYAGTSAMELKSVGTAFNFPGLAVSGTLTSTGLGSVTFGGGFSWATRSQKLSGYYKYTAGNGIDSALVKVILFKRNGANRDTIAVATKGLGGSTSYILFDAMFVYKDFSTNPDSALIIIQASKNLLAAQAGSIMLVDDLFFTGSVPAGVNNVSLVNITISSYPNPATEQINFSISNISNVKTLNVFDILGKKVKSIEITSGQFAVSTEGLNNSLYFYQVADKNNNVISTGKFSVKK